MTPDNPKALTRIEVATLQMLADGLTSEQVATRCGVGRSAINNRVHRSALKLGSTTRTNTVVTALCRGLIEEPRR